jgi:Na+-driven multidrug efflux pump
LYLDIEAVGFGVGDAAVSLVLRALGGKDEAQMRSIVSFLLLLSVTQEL